MPVSGMVHIGVRDLGHKGPCALGCQQLACMHAVWIGMSVCNIWLIHIKQDCY